MGRSSKSRLVPAKPETCSTPRARVLLFLHVQGRYVVLAAGCYAQLGVDVADVRPQDDVERYFGLMQPQFAPEEWRRIRARPTLDLQMVRDARLSPLPPCRHLPAMLTPPDSTPRPPTPSVGVLPLLVSQGELHQGDRRWHWLWTATVELCLGIRTSSAHSHR